MTETKKLTNEQVAALRATPLGSMPNKVRLARTLIGARAGDVAKAIGITAPYFSDIERGEYKDIPLESVLRPLSDLFGCRIEDLFPAREAVA
jgi:transcriptional regulator with XRE-family HTH domain